MTYAEDDMLMLSGIQHFMFCARQWALIHIEQVWDDNRLTAEGSLLHQNVDNPYYRQMNSGLITLRGVKVASPTLGLYGVADAVELDPEEDPQAPALQHPRYPGRWRPHVVEYKHGHTKTEDTDRVQLAAQVICLEEMYGLHLNSAALFYFETRRREEVEIDASLRETTVAMAAEMHRLFERHTLPSPPPRMDRCRRCSLYDLCLPQLQRLTSVSTYLKQNLYAETAEHPLHNDS
jgi:CRISPR-associated exonuclease Cas4